MAEFRGPINLRWSNVVSNPSTYGAGKRPNTNTTPNKFSTRRHQSLTPGSNLNVSLEADTEQTEYRHECRVVVQKDGEQTRVVIVLYVEWRLGNECWVIYGIRIIGIG